MKVANRLEVKLREVNSQWYGTRSKWAIDFENVVRLSCSLHTDNLIQQSFTF